MVQRSIHLPETLPRRIAEEARKRRYSSSAAFIRAIIQKEVDGHDDLEGVEQRIAATLDRFGRELFQLNNAQQALFALIEAFAQIIFECLPEPTVPLREQAIGRAKERHQKLLRMAAVSMQRGVGVSQASG